MSYWDQDQDQLDEQEKIADSIDQQDYDPVPDEDLHQGYEEQDEADEVLSSIMDDEDGEEQTLQDAAVRLAQARLYEMIANSDIFQDVNENKIAVARVKKEMRDFVMDRLSVLLGMKQETPKHQAGPIEVHLPFNDLEIQTLKDLAFKVTKGATGEYDTGVVVTAAPVESQIRPTLKPKAPPTLKSLRPSAGVQNRPKPVPQRPQRVVKKQQNRQISAKARPKPLEVAPSEMSKEDLSDRISETSSLYSKAKSPRAAPMVHGDAALAMWASRKKDIDSNVDVGNSAGVGSLIAASVGATGVKVESVSGGSGDGWEPPY